MMPGSKVKFHVVLAHKWKIDFMSRMASFDLNISLIPLF